MAVTRCELVCRMGVAPVDWVTGEHGLFSNHEKPDKKSRSVQLVSIYPICSNDSVYAIILSMTILVVDTSIMVSALIGAQGPSRELLRRCLKGEYKPLISNALYLEYEEVCTRQRILNLCPLNSGEIRDLIDAFYKVCDWIPIYYLWRPNSPDEGDNFLIELALAGNASHIVTNNVKDLQNIELKFPGLGITKPEDLLRGK